MVRVNVGGDTSEFDVLHRVAGVDHAEMPAFRARALEVSIEGIAVLIMHPIDVLASRFTNLTFSEKQNAQGIAQLRLALAMVGEFLKDIGRKDEEEALEYVKKVAAICKSADARRIRKRFQISCVAAAPIDMVANENYKTQRWPRLEAELA